ncbi:hypothetical protein JXA56_01015, partial [Candidatus Micrarchaeota archaeon]|nr:hypothetical protein [Candidatus Micrarchaeota archaeon]
LVPAAIPAYRRIVVHKTEKAEEELVVKPMSEPVKKQEAEPVEIEEQKVEINGTGKKKAKKKEQPKLAHLENERERFRLELFLDLSSDQSGEVKLESMRFIDFFVKSWYYDHAIARTTEGKEPEASMDDMYRAFNHIREEAEGHFRPGTTTLQKIKFFRSAMMGYFQGYERDAADFGTALIHGVFNCSSSTMVGIAGYSLYSNNVRMNRMREHVQAAVNTNEGTFVIENAGPIEVFYEHSCGYLMKPEYYVAEYLVEAGYRKSDFPREVNSWFRARVPDCGEKKPPSGFIPLSHRPGFSEKIKITEQPENQHIGREGFGAGWKEKRPKKKSIEDVEEPEKESGHPLVAVIYGKELAVAQSAILERFRHYAEKRIREMRLSLEGFEDTLGDMGNLYANPEITIKGFPGSVGNFLFPDPYLYTDAFEARSERHAEKRTLEDYQEKEVLPERIMKADVAAGRPGLLEDLWSRQGGDELVVWRMAPFDYADIAEKIADNRMLLFGDSSRGRLKSIHMRKLAFERAVLFCSDRKRCDAAAALLERRLDAIERVMKGEKVDGFAELFERHSAYKKDPLISLEAMGNGQGGVSLEAIEDLVSFRGEKKAIQAVAGYLERDDLGLKRISFLKLINATHGKLLFERESFAQELERILKTGKNVELNAAIAQFLHAQGHKTDETVGALAAYLESKEAVPRALVHELVEAGLPAKTAYDIIERKLRALLHDDVVGFEADLARTSYYQILADLDEGKVVSIFKERLKMDGSGTTWTIADDITVMEGGKVKKSVNIETIAYLLLRRGKFTKGEIGYLIAIDEEEEREFDIHVFAATAHVLGQKELAREVLLKLAEREKIPKRTSTYVLLYHMGHTEEARKKLLTMLAADAIEPGDETYEESGVAIGKYGSSKKVTRVRKVLYEEPLYALSMLGLTERDKERLDEVQQTWGDDILGGRHPLSRITMESARLGMNDYEGIYHSTYAYNVAKAIEGLGRNSIEQAGAWYYKEKHYANMFPNWRIDEEHTKRRRELAWGSPANQLTALQYYFAYGVRLEREDIEALLHMARGNKQRSTYQAGGITYIVETIGSNEVLQFGAITVLAMYGYANFNEKGELIIGPNFGYTEMKRTGRHKMKAAPGTTKITPSKIKTRKADVETTYEFEDHSEEFEEHRKKK